jgi:hypothetical protein
MDAEQFDTVVKALGQGNSRRRVLAGLLGAALAAPLGRAGAQECKRNGKPCKKNSQCCSGNCGVGTGQGPLPGACAPACPALPACTDTCPCPAGGVCVGGTCFLACSGGPVTCIDPSTGQPCPCRPLADGGGNVCVSSGLCATACSECLPGEACISVVSSAVCPSGLVCMGRCG